ncbi:MAG: hypothetical protein IPL29_02875, partial [Propionivibrio sp.]|nr:hypothetical protein [Propionivibrio sp.]
MPNYYTDFASDTAGSLPSTWTARFNGSGQYAVQVGGDDKILKCSSSTDNRKACSLNAVDSDANRDNIEIRAQFRTKSVAASTTMGGFIARGSGAAGSETGYIGGILGTAVYLTKYVNGAHTMLTSSTAFGTLAADTDYEICFRVNGSTISIRLWAKGGSDPGTGSNISVTDSSITGVGWAGVFGFAGVGKLEYDKIAIATNGDNASYSASNNIAASGSDVAGGSAAISSGVNLAASGSGVASGSATISGGATNNIAASGSDVASGSAALYSTVAVAASGAAVASGSAVIGSNISIINCADRGTVDLANCVVTPNGSTPNIFIKNRYFFEGANGARNCFFQVTGVNGMTPVFDCDKSNIEGTWAQHWKYSYTGALGSWVDFNNFSDLTSPNVYRSSNNSAFTQDSVYVTMNLPWRVGYTLPWIQSLVSSGFVSEAPSSAGNNYVFATRSATTDGATDGTGNT